MMARHSFSDYKQALKPNGQYLMVGGDMSLVYKFMLMKPLLSLKGNTRMSYAIA